MNWEVFVGVGGGGGGHVSWGMGEDCSRWSSMAVGGDAGEAKAASSEGQRRRVLSISAGASHTVALLCE